MLEVVYEDIVLKNCFTKVTWSGSTRTSSRVLEFTILKDKTKFELGKKVVFNVGNNQVFVGKVFYITNNTKAETFTVRCYDNAVYLNRNNFLKNYLNETPSQITKGILAEIKLEPGALPKDVTRCTFPALDRSGFEIITMAYKIQNSKDKKVYTIHSEDDKISIVEQGILIPDFSLSTKKNIRFASYSEDIEEMVNKVILYENKKDSPSIIGIRANEEDIKKYGIFQVVQEQDKSNASYLQVEKILKGVTETAEITCDGDTRLTAGFNILIDVSSISNLKGSFLISDDTHVWEAGDYYCDLKLAFENVMADVDISVAKKREPYKKKKKEKEKKKKYSLVEGE